MLVSVNNSPLFTKVDSGSDVSYIDQRVCSQLNLPIYSHCIAVEQVEGYTYTTGIVYITMSIATRSYCVALHVLKDFRFPLLIGKDIGRVYSFDYHFSDNTV